MELIDWIAVAYLCGLVLGFGIGLWVGHSVVSDERQKSQVNSASNPAEPR